MGDNHVGNAISASNENILKLNRLLVLFCDSYSYKQSMNNFLAKSCVAQRKLLKIHESRRRKSWIKIGKWLS